MARGGGYNLPWIQMAQGARTMAQPAWWGVNALGDFTQNSINQGNIGFDRLAELGFGMPSPGDMQGAEQLARQTMGAMNPSAQTAGLAPALGGAGRAASGVGSRMKEMRQQQLAQMKQAEAQQKEELIRQRKGQALEGYLARNPQMADHVAPFVEAGDYDGAWDMLKQAKRGGKQPSSVQEYQFAKEQGYTGNYQEWVTEGKKAGATTINVGGEQEGFEKKYGGALADQAAEIVQGQGKALSTLQKVNGLEAMLNEVETGRLAPAQATVGAWAKAFGTDPKSLGVDPNVSVVGDALPSVIANLTVGMIGPGGFPANQFTEADREFILKTFPQLGDTPEAIKIKLEVVRRVEQFKIETAQKWYEARQQGKSFEQFMYESGQQQEDKFADLMEASQSLPQTGGQAPSFSTEEEALKSGVKGEVIIGGRRAVID